MRWIRCAAASIVACATIVAVGASAAAAKTVTIHFFSKQVYTRISDASGKPLNSAPAAGDRVSFASDDYAGSHSHHAKQTTASDHIVCTEATASSALCDGTIAIWRRDDPWG